MALADLWNASPEQLLAKHVHQVIAFAGSGKLRDGQDASREFREFLALVPSTILSRYADECLTTKFDDSGLALQDVVNEIGQRLGFNVNYGFYRGSVSRTGYDGIWRAEDGKSIVVEVKTTDAYRIDLDAVAGYRQSLVQDGTLGAPDSSILIIVGREDTGDLEAQIRGSRHAWDTRLISVDALIGLMRLKENLEEPLVVRKIRDVLTPHEYTKVDGIIDIVFATAEDVRLGDAPSEEEDSGDYEQGTKFTPSAFHDACIKRIGVRIMRALVKRTRATYTSADGKVAVVCMVSRPHGRAGAPSYWYAFHPHQRDGLLEFEVGYVAFGCGSADAVILIPIHDFEAWLEGMNMTQKPDRFYWHVSIFEENGKFVLRRKRGFERIDLTRYLLPDREHPVPG